MAVHVDTARETDLLMEYCFNCDQPGPHYIREVDDQLIFQCGSCFAAHTDVLPELHFQGNGRHRAFA